MRSLARSIDARLSARFRDWPSLADQLVSSASNFVVAALVARGAGPTGYAPFALAMAVWFLALGIQRSCLIEPMTLTVSKHEGDDLVEHMANGYVRAVGFSVGVGAIGALVAVTVHLLAVDPTASRTATAFAIALPLLLLQDATRWQFLALRRGSGALLNDIVFAFAEIGAVVALLARGNVTAASAFTAIAIGAGIAVVIGYIQVRLLLARPLPRRIRGSGAPGIARWLVVDFLYTWSWGQSTLFVVAGVLGAHDTGVYRAIHDLFGPLRLLNLGVVTVLLPSGAAAFNRAGSLHLSQTTRRATRYAVIAGGLYCGGMAVFGIVVLHTVYGSAYAHDLLPLPLIALGYFLITTQLPMVVALKASYRVRQLGLGRIMLVPFVVGAVPILASAFGLVGAAIAFVLGATASRTVIGRQYKKMLSDTTVQPEPDQPNIERSPAPLVRASASVEHA